ncbi:MAG TPA: hypothetical protein VMF67_02985 [Rhizomicrobium sp.]|nr:hypothetical protein [Rhizomicrobium sp.]
MSRTFGWIWLSVPAAAASALAAGATTGNGGPVAPYSGTGRVGPEFNGSAGLNAYRKR